MLKFKKQLFPRIIFICVAISLLMNSTGCPASALRVSSMFDNGEEFYKQKGTSYYEAKGMLSKDLIKERLYARILRNLLPERAIIADMGCSVGQLTFELKKTNLNPIGLDLNDEFLKRAMNNVAKLGLGEIPYVKSDVIILPFQDASLDAISLTNVLEHFTEEEAARFLQEARRVLKKSGLILIGIPVNTVLSRITFRVKKILGRPGIDDTEDITHKIWYSDNRLFDLLHAKGFDVKKADYFVYRTSAWPRGTAAHRLQEVLDKYDSNRRIKRRLAFGMYAIAVKRDDVFQSSKVVGNLQTESTSHENSKDGLYGNHEDSRHSI